MGGGSAPSPPPITEPVPSAADEEAAAERARLYGLLRSRRSGMGLAFGPRRRTSLLSTILPAAPGSPASPLVPSPFLYDWGGGSGGVGAGDGGGSVGEQGGGVSDPGGISGTGGTGGGYY